MRTLTLLLSIILVLSTVALAPAGLAKNGEDDDEGDASDPGSAEEREDENPENRTAENETGSDNRTKENPSKKNKAVENETDAQHRGPPEDRANERGRERGRGHDDDDRRREEAIQRYREAQQEKEQETEHDTHEDDGRDPDKLPEHVRTRMAGFHQVDGHIDGRYIEFDATADGLAHYTVGSTLLWPNVTFPAHDAPEVSVHGQGQGNTLRLRGEAWELRLTDAPAAPIHFKAEDGAMLVLALPENATVTPTTGGLLVAFPTDDQGLHGRFTGDATLDGGTIVVDGEAQFFVSAKRIVMENVANKARPQIEESLARGHFGAELNVLNAGLGDDDEDDAEDAVPETIVYNEMTVDFETDETSEESGRSYTITVDAEAHEGKTIAVNFESGLLDAENLVFRYFNVDANRTVEATIVQADSLQDVLDPTDDGTIAEYWVVTDVDGTQVLVSIPHFSIHKIEIQSLADVIVERPSLVLGTIGAIVVVAAAAVGMFRPPREEE